MNWKYILLATLVAPLIAFIGVVGILFKVIYWLPLPLLILCTGLSTIVFTIWSYNVIEKSTNGEAIGKTFALVICGIIMCVAYTLIGSYVIVNITNNDPGEKGLGLLFGPIIITITYFISGIINVIRNYIQNKNNH